MCVIFVISSKRETSENLPFTFLRYASFHLLKGSDDQFFSYEFTWKNVGCYECMNVSSVVSVSKHVVACNSTYAYIRTIAHISAVFVRNVSLKSRMSISTRGSILVDICLPLAQIVVGISTAFFYMMQKMKLECIANIAEHIWAFFPRSKKREFLDFRC